MKIDIVKDIKGIIINAEVAHDDYCGICNVEMVHAFDWYDQIEYISSNCVIDNGVLKTDSLQLENGIYILCCISDKNGEVILGSKPQEGFVIQKAFCIGNSSELADASIRDIYSGV